MDKTPLAASLADAEALDRQDPLRTARDCFELDDALLYLDGNSLGAPPKKALARLNQAAHVEWKQGLIRSWNDAGWFDLPQTCGRKIAALIGVEENAVIVCDSVSVNIFKLASALIAGRKGALAWCASEFPTDGYILQGLSRLTGAPLKKLADDDSAALTGDIAVLVKSAVHYKTAAVADIAAWEEAAKKHGLAIVWDLSHAAGVIDLSLARDGAQYAVGCGYKFLNGGPGAPAYVYADTKAAPALAQPLSGWMGHASPFDFSADYAPAEDIRRFACGTPPILSLSALDAALDVFDGLAMATVERKAAALGDLFLSRCETIGLETVSPGVGERRGGHVSLRHANGFEIVQALIADGVIGDFRAPDLMRFGFSPLYTGYADVWRAADRLLRIIAEESWRDARFARRRTVT